MNDAEAVMGWGSVSGRSNVSSNCGDMDSTYALVSFMLPSFVVIAAYCSNSGHFAFSSHPSGHGETYDVHLRLTEKRVVDFILVLNKLFC